MKRKIDSVNIDSAITLSEMLKGESDERRLSIDSSLIPERSNSQIYTNSTNNSHRHKH